MISNRRNKLSEINVTPLVDVMLVLLVIFMAVSPSMHSDVDVKVPVVRYVKTAPNVDKKNLLKIVISEKKLFVNEKEIIDSTLINELNKYEKNLVVFVKADEKLSYKRVFEILDLVKGSGFCNIALVGLVK